jgi:phosphoglycolate phosphatase
LPPSRYSDIAARYRVHWLAGEQNVRLFPMVAEGLGTLGSNGHLLAVATGKSRQGLDRALAALGLGQRFTATRCADEGLPKPHPDMLEKLMQIVGVAPGRTLMIGDTTHDLRMAQSAGAAAVAVAYGAHPGEELVQHSPLACVASFPELLQWLHGNA